MVSKKKTNIAKGSGDIEMKGKETTGSPHTKMVSWSESEVMSTSSFNKKPRKPADSGKLTVNNCSDLQIIFLQMTRPDLTILTFTIVPDL